jgi:hypothetical protein
MSAVRRDNQADKKKDKWICGEVAKWTYIYYTPIRLVGGASDGEGRIVEQPYGVKDK